MSEKSIALCIFLICQSACCFPLLLFWGVSFQLDNHDNGGRGANRTLQKISAFDRDFLLWTFNSLGLLVIASIALVFAFTILFALIYATRRLHLYFNVATAHRIGAGFGDLETKFS